MIKKPPIIIANNNFQGIYHFRRELLEALSKDYSIILSAPKDTYIEYFEKLNYSIELTSIKTRSISFFSDLKLFLHYRRLIRKYNPKCILSFTIKPNLYMGICARIYKIPQLANITGRGSIFNRNNFLVTVVIILYRFALKKTRTVFFQNQSDLLFFSTKKIVHDNYKLLPGSGVNLDYFSFQEYPKESKIIFLFVGRIMKEKGIDLYLKLAEEITQSYKNVEFHIIGQTQKKYKSIIEILQKNNTITYHSPKKDIREYYKNAHCIIHPTYYSEGMSNVLLEASATGRPVIASNIPGCIETIVSNISGFAIKPNNFLELVKKTHKFISLSYLDKKEMGKAARNHIHVNFDRKLVINEYLARIK